jgi:acetoin utilization deacetylase AcuC-like enzyme
LPPDPQGIFPKKKQQGTQGLATACFAHPDCAGHETPEGHPERVARLAAVERGVAGLLLERHEAPLGAEADILRCHPADYVERIRRAVPEAGVRGLDPDTWVSPGSLTAALRAVGGACAAVDLVLSGGAEAAFVGCRPPSHHAERDRAMGFCLFGTAAIAAMRALEVHGLSRVAVLDFDVHHGNGTQDILWNEARVRFVSSHQMPLYPGTGEASERGAHGQIENLPLAEGSGGAEMWRVWQPALERLRAWGPELILISAGFDAHRDDPLAGLMWDEGDFARLTAAICDVARECCSGRVVSTLEGGYDLRALAASVAAHVGELARNAR